MTTDHDWSRADELIQCEALTDPDAQQMTPERLAGMTQRPRPKIIRRPLGLAGWDG
jgi:putative transcriptional regulator